MNKHYYFSLVFFLLIFISFSCKEGAEKKNPQKDTISQIQNKKPLKYFSGNPDVPVNSNQITSAGIGDILLGDSIERFSRVYENEKVVDITIGEYGKEWPGKKLISGKYYVVAEVVNTVDMISKLKTNNPNYITKNGIHVGMKIDSIPFFNDSLTTDFDHKAFMYGKSGVWFKIDPKREKNYFKSTLSNPEILKGGSIEEFFIICADC